MKKILKTIFDKNKIKQRLPYALLAGFNCSFMFFFFGILEMFAGNRDELLFSFKDFGGYITLLALAVSALIVCLILFVPEKASSAVFGVAVWFTVMGYLQAMLLNGTGTLGGDTSTKMNIGLAVADAIIWVISGVAIVTGAFLMPKKNILKRIFIIALLMVLVMQITGCVSQIGDITRDPGTKNPEYTDTEETTTVPDETTKPTTLEELETVTETDTDVRDSETPEPETSEPETTEPETTEPETTEPETTAPATTAPETTAPKTENQDPAKAYLTKQGLDQVSTGKNIVIFLIDRFDVSFYNSLIDSKPDFFDRLDGFTYFSDNISLYSRTYPGVPTMITGVDIDFNEMSASQYFAKAYGESDFLGDLKANGYKIKIYTQSYYCYREGTPLVGVADNISLSSGYKISSTKALVDNLITLSAYRYLPNALKDSVNISTASFSGIVKLNGTAPLYEIDDPATCGLILDNHLSFDDDGDSYIFIHLNGCHSPYNMDENGRRTKDANSKEQLQGCFKMIYSYIDDMKRLGVYDDATIIITGDHPRARDDEAVPTQTRVTSLFVKPAGSTGPLQYSKAQVSQANLIPTIVKSSGIKTDHDYGLSYFDIPEGENTVRYHKFQLSDSPNQIVTFRITGKGTDFDNWSIDNRQKLNGSFYR